MIFYGNGHVWDKDRNSMLCNFKGGELDTDNDRTIKILQSLGYKSEFGDEIIVDSVEVDDDGDIRNKAKELGIKSWHVKSIDNLISEIKEAEDE